MCVDIFPTHRPGSRKLPSRRTPIYDSMAPKTNVFFLDRKNTFPSADEVSCRARIGKIPLLQPAKVAAYKATPQAEKSKSFWLSSSVVGPPFAPLIPKNFDAIWQCRQPKMVASKSNISKSSPTICGCTSSSGTADAYTQWRESLPCPCLMENPAP